MENFRKRTKSNSLKYKLLKLKWCQTREKPGFWHRTFDWLRIMKCPSEIKSFDYSRNLPWLLMEFPLVRCHIFKQGCIWLESFKFSFLLFSVGLHLKFPSLHEVSCIRDCVPYSQKGGRVSNECQISVCISMNSEVVPFICTALYAR